MYPVRMLISNGSNRCSAEPVLRANRRNREPMSSGSLLLSQRSFLSPAHARCTHTHTHAHTRARLQGERYFLSPLENRFFGTATWRDPPRQSYHLALLPLMRPRGSFLVQISILRRQLFAHPTLHSVTHMEMEIGHRNPVCRRKHPGRVNRVPPPSRSEG